MAFVGKSTRRTFLKTSLAATGPFILPFGAAPDPVRIGYVGAGRRSNDLLQVPEGAVITAFSDLDSRRLEARQARFPKAAVYSDYREMLASGQVDAVIVATPDHWHTLPVIHACQSRIHVYIEKPVSLTVAEGRAMAQAARKYGVVVQSGSQQRSMESCRRGCDMVREGALGKVSVVHGACYPSPWDCDLPEEEPPAEINWDMWCGQTTPRGYHPDLFLPRAENRKYADGRPYGWISYTPYSGGEMTGWGAHGLDIVQWALGTDMSGPVEVWPEPEAMPDEAVFFGKKFNPADWPEGKKLLCPVSFRYADGTVLRLDGKGPGGGAHFECEGGSIRIDRGKFAYKRNDGEAKEFAEPEGANDTATHIANWIDTIRNGGTPAADIEIGHRSATVCHLGNIARWIGRKLTWDPEKELFVGDDEANGYLKRTMREPWSIGEI